MKRLALFSSFIPSSQNKLPRYIFYYLQQIRPHIETLVFIYNEDFDISASLEQLRPLVDDIMPVKNEGFDFGMWQKGLKKHNAEEYDELCLLNDSCVCIGSFDNFFKWNENSNNLATALTLSNEYTQHLQSYFLVIKNAAIHLVVEWISKQNFAPLDWQQVVIAGELGLSLYLRMMEINIVGLFFGRDPNINITVKLPEELVIHDMPLVKKKSLIWNTENFIETLKIREQQNFPHNEKLFPPLTEIIKQHCNLSLEQCHLLFEWMPFYVLDQKIYQGKL